MVIPSLNTGSFARWGGLLAVALSVAACGSSGGGSKSGGGGSAQRGTYKIGNPYKIDGVTYTPQETFTLVETGVASWYGPGFHGKSTANGERYDQSDRTAAHRTLQMPAVVRVTNLDNGMSTVVRVNDRGPFARNRIIDLSRTAAQELDMVRNGTARVRIEQLQAESMVVKDVAIGGGGPSEQHEALAQLASGRRTSPAAAQTQVAAAPVPVAPEPVVVPPPAPPQTVIATPPPPPPPAAAGPSVASLSTAVPTSSANGFYVQVGAFGTRDAAERQRGAIRSYGNPEISPVSFGNREVFRVRLGPYTTMDAAAIVADRLKRSGYGEPRVVAE